MHKSGFITCAVNTTNDFENELAARFGDASPAEVGWTRAELR